MNTFNEDESEKYLAFESAMPLAPASKDVLPAAINPDAPHWTWQAAIGILILSVLSLIFFSLVSGVCFALIKGFPAAGEDLLKNPTLVLFTLASVFPAHFITLGLVWLLVTRNGRQSFWQSLGWDWGKNFGFWACLGTTVALFGIAILVASQFGEQENDLTRMLQSSRAAVYLTAVLATFTAPLVEEVVYRGVLYSAFRQRLGTIAAIFMATFFFAAIHVPQYYPSYGTILVICLLSLSLTLIRAWTGNLLPCVIIHTLFNGVQSILLLLEPYLQNVAAPSEPAPNLIFRLFSFFS